MPENSPSEYGYEDSYQKREKLRKELASVLGELERLIKVSQVDTNKLMNLLERYHNNPKGEKIDDEEVLGTMGDTRGTGSMIEQKLQELNDVRQQLKELKDWQND